MLRWSIATVCMGGSLEGKLAAAAKACFRVVELFENDLTFFNGKARDARRMAADLGGRDRRASAVARLRGHAGADPDQEFRAGAPQIRADARARRAALVPLLPTYRHEVRDDPTARRAAGDLAELTDIARQNGMRIGYEALAWGRHVKDWTAEWEIVRAAASDNLGIVLDSFHICVRGNPIAPIAELPGGEKSRSCRSPTRRASPWIRSRFSRHYRCYPGQGRLSHRRLSRRL